MRCHLGGGLRSADCLAIDRDDPLPAQQTDAGAHPRPHDAAEQLAIDPGQHPAGRGLARTPRTGHTQPGQHAGVRFGDPFTDRGERACPGQHRGQRHRQA